MDITLTRILRLGCTGTDVEGWARAAHRYLKDGQLAKFEKQPALMRRTFGAGKRQLAKKCAAKANLPEYGVVGPALDEAMRSAGAYDARSQLLLREYELLHALPPMVYPHPLGAHGTYVGQGPHGTAGIAGNIAIDFMAPGGTAVFAVENATITKLSGHAPGSYVDQGVGIFGWNIHYQTKAFYRYFSTHYGDRAPGLHVGQQVRAGDVVGHVGHWPGSEGRSHTHLGVTSPLGVKDATKRIKQVASSERVH